MFCEYQVTCTCAVYSSTFAHPQNNLGYVSSIRTIVAHYGTWVVTSHGIVTLNITKEMHYGTWVVSLLGQFGLGAFLPYV